jgi:hypothetical protein
LTQEFRHERRFSSVRSARKHQGTITHQDRSGMHCAQVSHAFDESTIQAVNQLAQKLIGPGRRCHKTIVTIETKLIRILNNPKA